LTANQPDTVFFWYNLAFGTCRLRWLLRPGTRKAFVRQEDSW